MTVVLVILVVLAVLYVRAHVPPSVVRWPKRPETPCDVHIGDRSYRGYPGETVELAFHMYSAAMDARARQQALDRAKRMSWGHSFLVRERRCSNCGLSMADFQMTPEPERRQCDG